MAECSWAIGAHDEECDLVAGLGEENRELRAFVKKVELEANALSHYNARDRLDALSSEAVTLLAKRRIS